MSNIFDMKRKARILLSILALFFISTYISCTEHQSFAQQDPLSELFRKKEVTIVVTDSGLGGLSILMDLLEKLEVSRAFQRVKLIFVNALFSNEGGYNSLNTREEKILVFDSALHSMEKRYRPDLIMIGCNTLSVLYNDTSFARQTRTPVLDIVGYGVDLISENLKSRPDAKVVIMGTQTTIEEGTYKSILIDMGFLPDRIITQACPDLVTYIEKGYDSDETEMLIYAYVDEVLQKIPRDKDSLLVSLNCTHYGYSASLWEKAFENLGVTPLAIVNPNTRMNSLFETEEYFERFKATDIDVRVISMVDIPEDRMNSIGRWLRRESPQVARALSGYTKVPDLFEWRHLVKLAKGQHCIYNLVKIHVADTKIIEELEANPEALDIIKQIRKYNFHFVSNISPGFLWAMVTDKNLIFLKQHGYRVEQIRRGTEIELHKRIVWGEGMVLPAGYLLYDEIISRLQELQRLFPDISVLECIGQTQQYQKDIYAFKLSDNAKIREEEPKVLISAAIHGNEIMGTEVCLALLEELLRNYNRKKQITGFVNSLEIWFIPVINVDGYDIATKLNPSWRKNGRGVDLNRNFDYNWETSGNSDSTSRYYRGTAPFSEKETRILAEFVKEHKFVFSITYHSAEARVYFPWRSRESDSYGFAPENDLLSEIAGTIAGKIKCLNEEYTYQAVRNIKTDAYTTNYYYGILGTIDFIIELGKYDHVYSQPVLNKIIEHNLPGAYYLLERAAGPGLSGRVTDADTGEPLYAEVRILKYDNTEISPRTTHPVTGQYYRVLKPDSYQVLITAPAKQSRLISEVVVNPQGWTELNVELKK